MKKYVVESCLVASESDVPLLAAESKNEDSILDE